MITRRAWLAHGGVLLAAGAAGCGRKAAPPVHVATRPVAILRARSYSDDLADRLMRGAALCGLQVRGKRVLVKPNLVEFDRDAPIHTPVEVLAAAVEMCERLGAAQILIGEGPGHRRDTVFLAEEAGYRAGVPHFDARFVDLNRDDVAPAGPFAGAERIYLPRAALGADVIVSVARMKTHHWAGATLSMKNLFGLAPGALYGWPKNHLHQLGIDQSAAEVYRIFPHSFGIVDGIVGMEGNGPIQGRARACGVLVMGGDLAAVDETACRIMGIDPGKIGYLRIAAERGGVRAGGIEQRGETVARVHTPFELIPEFEHVRLG